MKTLVCLAALIVPMTACDMTTPPPQETVVITSADIARLPEGQSLHVDLGRDVAYLIDIRDPIVRDRVLLEYGNDATMVGDWLEVAGGLADPTVQLFEPGGCAGGWELRCSGNVCCTVCQANGQIGDCQAVSTN